MRSRKRRARRTPPTKGKREFFGYERKIENQKAKRRRRSGANERSPKTETRVTAAIPQKIFPSFQKKAKE